LTNRNRASLNALALAALLILLFSPSSLYDVGFQLSFASLLSILLIQPLFESPRIVTYLFDRPILRWLWGLCTVSISAQVGVAPLIAYYFGRFSTYFILTNLLVIPAVTAILYLALISLLLPVAGLLLLKIVGWLNGSLSFIATSLPFASIEGLHPSALQTVLVYVFLFSIYLMITTYDKRF
jgi:competence protein ComEC